MSLQILNAHTGARYAGYPEQLYTLNFLRTWITKLSTVAAQNQILLTAQGRQAKLQTLRIEGEIFLYDRQLLVLPSTGASKPKVHSIASTPLHSLELPPDLVGSQNDLRAWQTLFRERQSWALASADKCRSISNKTRQHWDGHLVIERGLLAALENLKSHVRILEQKQGEAHEWAEGALMEYKAVLEAWEAISPQLKEINAREDILRFGFTADTLELGGTTDATTSLAAVHDERDVAAAVSVIRSTVDQLSSQTDRIEHLAQQIVSESEQLSSTIEQEQGEVLDDISEQSAQVLEDIDVVASKVAADYEHILTLPATAKSLSQASKMGLLQARNYLPGIQEDYDTMQQHLRSAIEQRNASATTAIEHMQTIAKIQSVIANANTQLQALDIPPTASEALGTLTLLSRLPLAYGLLLVEAVRRRDWISKLRADTSTLAEEFAGYQEGEEKRRNKWLRTIDGLINTDAVKGRALAMDINIRGPDQAWPDVTRDEVDEYLKQLSTINSMDTTVKEVRQALNNIDRTTRQQSQRAGAFKMGSLHETEFGKGSLLLRGDDELRQLKDANARLQDELQSQKSRVRKLEDVVHRQSQQDRTLPGHVYQASINGQDTFQPSMFNAPQSPVYDDALSRRSSVASRRLSANQSSEDKKLARRIVGLEAELMAQKEQRQQLEAEVGAKQAVEADIRSQINDLNATKKDLMDNMEAQQREFASERKVLEDDNSKYRARVEDVEDELDRILSSRENLKAGEDNMVRALELKLERAQESAAADLLQEQHKAKDNAAKFQQMHSALQLNFEQLQDAQNEHRHFLQELHSHVSPDEAVPHELGALQSAVDMLVARTVEHEKSLAEALAITKSENQSLQARLDTHKAESTQARAELQSREEEISRLDGQAAIEAGKVATLSDELEDTLRQLRNLQDKFADGETGSESLRQRIADEESKVARLLKELTDAKSHVNGLDVELLASQKNHRDLQAELNGLNLRLHQRSNHARDLTQRLYTHNSRLSRLLESLGFVVAYSDDSMTVQRVSKTGGASVLLSDPAASINANSIAGPSPSARKAFEEIFTPDLLDWMTDEEGSREEQNFLRYSKAMDQLNLDIFSETIIKRLRDMEHTARKWQKDARTHRDRSHRAQTDAQEKIAFRTFKEGDLALFLPTRNQANRPWAAFNVGAPHYFLREQDSHRLRNREWLVARITRIEERVVDLSKGMDASNTAAGDGRSIGETSDGASFIDDDNPFELSDGLRWYLVDAAEERAGAPSTPGLGKSTVASAHIDAKGSIRVKKAPGGNDAGKALNKSLDSRRSSSNSKKGVAAPSIGPVGTLDTVVSVGEGEGEDRTLQTTTGSKDPDPSMNNDEERLSRTISPAKAALIRASSPAKSSKGMESSPTKASRQPFASSPSKAAEKQKGGLWDTLWQFDLSYESGKKR